MAYLGRPGATAPLTTADIPDNSITAAKIVDATIAAGDLAPNSVDSSELVDGSIDTSHIGDDQVTGDKLANDIAISTTGNIATTGSGTLTSAGNITANGDIDMQDDKGIIFGTGDDFWWGIHTGMDASGDDMLTINSGSTKGRSTNEGEIQFFTGAAGERTKAFFVSGEDAPCQVNFWVDQGDDSSDKWSIFCETDGNLHLDNASNQAKQNVAWTNTGDAYSDGAWNSNTWDYAELFEWKTHLETDDAVKELHGMSVVLDDGKVRIAEAGDEDNILGVVRAKGSTATHGDGLRWQNKFIKDVWGEYEMENYTLVTWNEYLPNGNIEYRHGYNKDEIPAYRMNEIGRDKNHHLKEENFMLDKEGEKIPVVVPSTDDEKTSSNYKERNHVKNNPDKLLLRRKYAPDYDESTTYIRRTDRPKEWVLIGLLGQVPVNTSTIIPSHWKKFYNLESGVDKYFIYNK